MSRKGKEGRGSHMVVASRVRIVALTLGIATLAIGGGCASDRATTDGVTTDGPTGHAASALSPGVLSIALYDMFQASSPCPKVTVSGSGGPTSFISASLNVQAYSVFGSCTSPLIGNQTPYTAGVKNPSLGFLAVEASSTGYRSAVLYINGSPTPTFTGLPAQAPVNGALGTIQFKLLDPVTGLPINIGGFGVTVAISGSGAHLGGTRTQTMTNGVVTFPDLTVDAVGSYTLSVTPDASGVSGATSAPFDVTGVSVSCPTPCKAGAAARVDWRGLPGDASEAIQIAPVGSALGANVAAQSTGSAATGSAVFTTLGDGYYVARAVAGGGATLLSESTPFTVVPIDARAPDLAQATIVPFDRTANDNFALNGAAIDGNTAVFTNDHLVYVYVRAGTSWTLQGSFDPSRGRVLTGAVAIRGDRIAVVAAGEGYSYVRSGTTWAPTGSTFAGGTDIAVSGAVAAATRLGHVYISVDTGPFWSTAADLTMPSDGGFASSVAMAGDTVVVGGNDRVYVYRQSGAAWPSEAQLSTDDGSGTHAPVKVAIDGDTIVASDNQSVWVFTRAGTTWSLQTHLPATGATLGRVAVAGDALAVTEASGAKIRLYARKGSVWYAYDTLAAPTTKLGAWLGMSGDTLVTGSAATTGDPYIGFTTLSSGLVYVSPPATTGASKLAFVGTPTSLVAGSCMPIAVETEDANGVPFVVPTDTSVQLTALYTDASCTLPGPATITAGFSRTTVYFGGTSAGQRDATAVVQGLTPVSFTYRVDPDVPATIAFTTGPSTVARASTLQPAVTVRVTDRFGNVETAGYTVALALGANPSGAKLTGTTSRMTDPTGTASFADIAIDKAGSGYTLVASTFGISATSAPFDVIEVPLAISGGCTMATCTPVTPLTVTFTGLAGNPRDWIAIAPAGSPLTTVLAWSYVGGAVNGTQAFAAQAAGSYVARAFSNDTYTLVSESAPFDVTPLSGASSVTASCSASPCTPAATVTVSFSGLPGYDADWIAIVPSGAPTSLFVKWAYTGGRTSGTLAFTGLQTGTFVARALQNNTYAQIGSDSAPFDVQGGAITLSVGCAPSCAQAQSVAVTFAGMPGYAYDWIGVFQAGRSAAYYERYAYTGGASAGTIDLGALPPGTYTAKGYANEAEVGSSTTFTVAGATGTPTLGVSEAGGVVTVTYALMAGYQRDWIAIAPSGGGPMEVVAWVYTNGKSSGTTSFNGLPPGTYVARAFFDDSFVIAAESGAFGVP
jgi:hypothetical protein